MKTLTIKDIRDLKPCYDPSRYLPEDWSGTVIDILDLQQVPAQDRLWVVLSEALIDARTLRLFAVWCARGALNLVKNPDPRSVAACDVAEKYANGEATEEELDAAWAAARATARDAAWAAARAAARAAAWAAARAAAWDAARDAAWAAAWAAARDAARDAARAAAWDAQISQLKIMLKGQTK